MILTPILYLLAAVALITTALPLWRTTRWWVRICDFPRFQIAILAVCVLVLLPLVAWPLGAAEMALMVALAAAAAWQLSWIWRYLPGAPREVKTGAAQSDAPDRVTLLTTNVKQSNRDSAALLHIIHDADPDVVLTVETDEWWCARLGDGLRARYPHSLVYPLSNGYGLALFSRLELVDASIRFLVDEAIPSARAGVRLRSGAVVDLYGLHPQPPSLNQDSAERDTELVRAGMEAARSQRPSVVLGDLNDVAWSPTTSAFRRVSALLDPRRGRGFFNTYPARYPGLRYPLDYIFHTPHFAVCEMRVLEKFGSDHLPLKVALCLSEQA